MIRSRGVVALRDGTAILLKRVRVTVETPLLESPFGRIVGNAQAGSLYPYVGAAAGSTRAVFVNTARPYEYGLAGPAVLYVAASAIILEDIPVLEAERTIQVLLDGKPVGAPIIVGGR